MDTCAFLLTWTYIDVGNPDITKNGATLATATLREHTDDFDRQVDRFFAEPFKDFQ